MEYARIIRADWADLQRISASFRADLGHFYVISTITHEHEIGGQFAGNLRGYARVVGRLQGGCWTVVGRVQGRLQDVYTAVMRRAYSGCNGAIAPYV